MSHGSTHPAPCVPPLHARVHVLCPQVEKRFELKSHGHGQPSYAAYERLALALGALLPPPHVVVLQTSSLSAHEHFLDFARGQDGRLTVVATENPRSDNDRWAAVREGEAGARATEEGTIAAVALYLASRAEWFVTLSSSAWTYLVKEVTAN